ncbi:hypothetical protein [Methanolacinia petrolearia]|uniref:hypothetical protein n=1 Tax=Methanolacinia petrolearia TaxID=54120 RepID=UPI003BA9E578
MFSKYRVLYVDYDIYRLSVRLPDEQKFIPAAAAEIEKLMDYAHLLEVGDMEICEPSEISPEEFIEGIHRFSAPSMRSHSKFHHPSDGFFLWNLLMSLRSLGLFHSKEWMKMRISTKNRGSYRGGTGSRDINGGSRPGFWRT